MHWLTGPDAVSHEPLPLPSCCGHVQYRNSVRTCYFKSSVPMLGICMTAMTCSLCAGLSYLQLHMHTRACDASDWLNAFLVLCRTFGHGRRQGWWRHATAARMPATWCGPSCWGCRLMTCRTVPLPAWCGMPSAAPQTKRVCRRLRGADPIFPRFAHQKLISEPTHIQITCPLHHWEAGSLGHMP